MKLSESAGRSFVRKLPFAFLLVVVFASASMINAQPRANGNGGATPSNPPAAVSGTSPAKPPAVTTEALGLDVVEALRLIQQNHVVGKQIDYNELFKSSIGGMLKSLDPHSNYFDAKEFEQFRTDQSSRYFGIGATINDLTDSDGKMTGTYIRATFENAPANRVGLKYGDKILDVNGVSMVGKPFTEVRDHLRGPRGTAAKVTVERNDTGKRETVEIIRDAVPQPSIAEAYMIRPGTGYIAMTGGFTQTTYAEFAEAMTRLKAAGMTQLVLDLKGNGGGLVSQAYRVANTFLESGQTIFTQKGRLEGVTEPFRAENPLPETMPIVIMVNRGSASASEILAGALQDHDRALIVGENTFGKGLVQNPFILEYGSMLLLTVAKYETPSGRLIQRDYSDGSLYSYYTNGGVGREDDEAQKPNGDEAKTDLGRTVYSGGGIAPDIEIKADTIPIERARFQQKLANPIFAFALDLTAGRVKGLESLKVSQPIRFSYDITAKDFPITEPVLQAFKRFAKDKFGYTDSQLVAEKEFIQRMLRSELVTAAYGTTASFQVFNEYDTQLKKAIDALPKARELAMQSAEARRVSIGDSGADNR